jgi:hypothetical protein
VCLVAFPGRTVNSTMSGQRLDTRKMTLNKVQPIFDPTTHYQIEVRGRVDVEWLQSFDSSVEIIVDETRQQEEITVISVHTDQAGIVGLMRKLHELRMTILHLQAESEGKRTAEF